MRTAAIAAAAAAAAVLTLATTAAANPPKGSVAGKFTIGILAEGDPLAGYIRFSNVFCAWSKGHVLVHVSFRNTGAEHVTLSVVPRYFIARGGEHGSSLGGHEEIGLDSGQFRSAWIDAEKPEGVAPKAAISRCAPYLFSIKSG